MKHTVGPAVAVLLLAAANAAQGAGPLRCDGRLIRPGVPAAYVLAQCGPPQTQLLETGPVHSRLPSGFVTQTGTWVSEFWIYDRGYGRFPAQLRFDNGRLVRIEHLPKRSDQRR